MQLIYESKGLSSDEAKRVVDQVLTDKTATLDALAREELGIDPTELGGSAYEAALASFILFAWAESSRFCRFWLQPVG